MLIPKIERKTKSKLYNTWSILIARRNQPGKGVSQAWIESFDQFHFDVGGEDAKTEDNILKRKDVLAPYSARNFEWLLKSDANRRTKNSVRVEYRGQVMCLSEAVRQEGLKYATVRLKILQGITVNGIKPLDYTIQAPKVVMVEKHAQLYTERQIIEMMRKVVPEVVNTHTVDALVSGTLKLSIPLLKGIAIYFKKPLSEFL